MKVERAPLFAILIAALIAISLMVFAREPQYRGRPLTSWLRQYSKAPLMETQRLAEAKAAIRAMGARRILPDLLKLVEAKDNPITSWITARSDKFHLEFLKRPSAMDVQQLGIAGFEALETNAAPAIGELTLLLADPQHAFTAVRCLIGIGPPAEAAVSQALTNKSVQVRYFATQQFAWVTGNTEDFLAHMEKCLHDPDGSVRFAAVQGIGLQTHAPDSAIPLLLLALRDPQDAVSSWAAKFLADFRTNALGSFPDLSNAAAKVASPATTRAALQTMVALAPQKAWPIVLENLRSSDPVRRGAAGALLSKYPMTNLAVQSAIEQAAADPDPALARRAKELMTIQYQTGHPLESQFSNEPCFGGKSLGQWLTAHDAEGAFSDEAKHALQQMGTNAITSLLKRLVYVKPPCGLPDFAVNMNAVRGFITLGSQAKPALPRLQALMDSTNGDLALHAMLASCGCGSNALPLLIKGLTNKFPDVRNEASNLLTGNLSLQFLKQRKEAVPFLVKLLDDPDENVRLNATSELKEIDPERWQMQQKF